MRQVFVCRHCLKSGHPLSYGFAAYRQDGIFDLRCPNGHRSMFVLQQHRYEVLFHLGCEALTDGYFREAISSFAAALERFYEYASRVLLYESTGSDVAFTSEVWPGIKKQSERQLGGYVMLWASKFKRAPKLLDEKLVALRNEVVHQGKLSTRDEAIKYGQAVLDLLVSNGNALAGEVANAKERVDVQGIRDRHPQPIDGVEVETLSVTLILTHAVQSGELSLEHHLGTLITQKSAIAAFSANNSYQT